MVVKGLYDKEGTEYEMCICFNGSRIMKDNFNVSFNLYEIKKYKHLIFFETKERVLVHEWINNKVFSSRKLEDDFDWVVDRLTETVDSLFTEYCKATVANKIIENNLEKLRNKEVLTKKAIIKRFAEKL